MSNGDQPEATLTTTAAQRRSWWAATITIGACAAGSVWLLVWGVWWCLTHAH